jgi:hypothetical protein
MDGFQPVTLTWKGKDYVVPADRQMKLIRAVEGALIGERGGQVIAILFNKGGVPHGALAEAFGAALRYAGARVTDEEVYFSIHEDIAAGSQAEVVLKTQSMIWGLMSIISPPVTRAASGAADTGKKP